MDNCIFCKIAKKEIPTILVKETNNFVVFKDIKPSAPIHFLIVSKEHLGDLKEVNDQKWAEVKKIALELGEEQKLSGFRIANNVGDAAMIKHFHVHFLGGIKVDRNV